MADHIDALQNIRLGIEMDQHCLDDADERLAALDAAIAALAQQAGAVANDAYEHGWVNASLWAARDDLISDIGSPAYIKARDAVLASSAPGGGGEVNLRESALALADLAEKNTDDVDLWDRRIADVRRAALSPKEQV